MCSYYTSVVELDYDSTDISTVTFPPLSAGTAGYVFSPAEADIITDKFFHSYQHAVEKIKDAATGEHISQKQVDHLNDRLKNMVDRLIATSQKSPVLAEAIRLRIDRGITSDWKI